MSGTTAYLSSTKIQTLTKITTTCLNIIEQLLRVFPHGKIGCGVETKTLLHLLLA